MDVYSSTWIVLLVWGMVSGAFIFAIVIDKAIEMVNNKLKK